MSLYFLLDSLSSAFSAHAEAAPQSQAALTRDGNAPSGADSGVGGSAHGAGRGVAAGALATADPAAAGLPSSPHTPDPVGSSGPPPAGTAPSQQPTHAGREGGASSAAGGAPAAAAEPASPEARLQTLLNDKSCRACTSTRDLFAAFGRQMQATGASLGAGAGPSPGAAPAADSGGGVPPFWFTEDEMPEPPDVVDIGRATWTLLHTMAAYYPERPTPAQQASMAGFVAALSDHYPCHECRAHLQSDLERHPPALGGAAELSQWACRLHNRVNVYLGKPEFDCGRALARWRDGAGDGPYGLKAHNAEVDAVAAAAAAAVAEAAVAGAGAVAANPAAASSAAAAGEAASAAKGAAAAPGEAVAAGAAAGAARGKAAEAGARAVAAPGSGSGPRGLR
jgi:FAD-linked sulfhydryl oxidase